MNNIISSNKAVKYQCNLRNYLPLLWPPIVPDSRPNFFSRLLCTLCDTPLMTLPHVWPLSGPKTEGWVLSREGGMVLQFLQFQFCLFSDSHWIPSPPLDDRSGRRPKGIFFGVLWPFTWPFSFYGGSKFSYKSCLFQKTNPRGVSPFSPPVLKQGLINPDIELSPYHGLLLHLFFGLWKGVVVMVATQRLYAAGWIGRWSWSTTGSACSSSLENGWFECKWCHPCCGLSWAGPFYPSFSSERGLFLSSERSSFFFEMRKTVLHIKASLYILHITPLLILQALQLCMPQ